MRLEVGPVDHERAGGGAFASQGLEDVIEDPGFAPTHEAEGARHSRVSAYLM